MDFQIDVSLTYRASVAVISALWNEDDIISDINEVLLEDPNAKQWTEIEDKVLKCLMTLEIPCTLKLNVQNFIQPMGVQILKWIDLCRLTFKVHSHNEKSIHFIWSDIGILDHIRTAELIIGCNQMHKQLCFCLACIFVLEKTILNLWPEVKDQLSRDVRWDPTTFESMAVVYWKFYLDGEIETLMNLTEYCGGRNPAEFAIIFYFDIKCMSALNYFLKQIETERKKKVIVLALFQIICRTTRPREGNTLILIFRLLKEFSMINELICENAYAVLSCFLEWPSQKLFISLANCLWDHLTTSEYLNLIQDIVEIKSRFYIGDWYKNIFKEFWESSPDHLREYAIHKCISGTLLSRLFLFGNTDDILQIIFNECSPEEKRSMIFYFEGMNICDTLIKKERWVSLKMFIKNCISSSDTLEDFLRQYQNYKPSFWNKETEMRTEILIKKVREWY